MQLYFVFNFNIFILVFAIGFNQDSILKFFISDVFILNENWTVLHKDFANEMGSFQADSGVQLVVQGKVCEVGEDLTSHDGVAFVGLEELYQGLN